MLQRLRRFLRQRAKGPILRLRPEFGFGDHLMLAAVIEGIKAEHPEYRIHLVADHPEMFWHNPHVDEVVRLSQLRRTDPGRLADYLEVVRRPPRARYMQTSGHLLDDMYACVGIPLRQRPHEPRLYLTARELRFRSREIERLPRPRIAIAPHGAPDVKLPNKVYPPGQWQAVARQLVASAGSVLQVGTRREGALVPGALDYRDLGYRHTASVLRRCDLLVTHVGGIMHLGAAFRVPTVVLYGAAEHPAISGYPWNRNLYTPIECGPCWMEERCSHLSCMRRLTPEVVMQEIRVALETGPGGTQEFPAQVLEGAPQTS